MYPNKTEAENKEVIENEVKELNEDEIEQVAGAGNPFEDIPVFRYSRLTTNSATKAENQTI